MISTPRIDASAREGSDTGEAIDAFCESVVRSVLVDPLTTEIVRLRCADYHHCRFCAAYREETALTLGLDETLVRKISHHETSDLQPSWKAALRLADALIIDPGSADAALRAELLEHFTEAQIAELIFDVMKWSVQKIDVSLAQDIPPREGLSLLMTDGNGHLVLGGPLSEWEPALAS